MPEKILGTLTSSIFKSVHNLVSPIISYLLYSLATPGHPEPIQLENHVRIIALTLDLHTVSFCGVIDFLHYSSTTELLLSLMLMKVLVRALISRTYHRKSLLTLWLPQYVNLCMIATRIYTSD